MTPQWKQLAAIEVLAELLCYSPPLSWTLDPTLDGPPELVGTPYLGTDEEHRAVIAAWSQILESPVVEEEFPFATVLTVRAKLGEVVVEIAATVGLTVPALDGAL